MGVGKAGQLVAVAVLATVSACASPGDTTGAAIRYDSDARALQDATKPTDASTPINDARAAPDTTSVNGYEGVSNQELALLRGALVWDLHVGGLSGEELSARKDEDAAVLAEQNRRVGAGEWPTKAFENPDLQNESNAALVQTIIENNDKLRELDGRTNFADNEKVGYGWIAGGIYVMTLELIARGAFIIVPAYELEPATKAALEA